MIIHKKLQPLSSGRVHKLRLAKLHETATKKRKRKQNPALLRTSLSSVQETISLQFKNSFRFNLQISALKFWKKNMYIFTARRRRDRKSHLGSNPNLGKLAAV